MEFFLPTNHGLTYTGVIRTIALNQTYLMLFAHLVHYDVRYCAHRDTSVGVLVAVYILRSSLELQLAWIIDEPVYGRSRQNAASFYDSR
jgi:hypothetical protein